MLLTGAPAPAALNIPESEKSRRRFERRLLSLLAQNPLCALAHADALAKTQWHDQVNGQLAECILKTLESDPAASAAQIVTAASSVVPRAAGILTSGNVDPSKLESTVAFLVAELEIGDMEDALAAMNAQLKTDGALSEDERNLVFSAAVDLQKTINAKRAAHKIEL